MSTELVNCKDCLFWIKSDEDTLPENTKFCFESPPNVLAVPSLIIDNNGNITGISSNAINVLPITSGMHKCGRGKVDFKKVS